MKDLNEHISYICIHGNQYPLSVIVTNLNYSVIVNCLFDLDLHRFKELNYSQVSV